MTTEHSEDAQTPLHGLPLFAQQLPPLTERVGAGRPTGAVAQWYT